MEAAVLKIGSNGKSIGRIRNLRRFEMNLGPAQISIAIYQIICLQHQMVLNIPETEELNEGHQTPESESILQSHVQMPVEATISTPAALLQTEQSTPILPDEQPGPSWHRDETSLCNQPNVGSPVRLEVPHRINTSIASSSPRRRRMVTARRHLINRSPPSQRRSQMATLTERFVAIEEKRLQNERLIIENQQKMLEIFKNISESWSRQTQALHNLCSSICQGNRIFET